MNFIVVKIKFIHKNNKISKNTYSVIFQKLLRKLFAIL
jgi:hypothetical protein